jgi:hypothetical protein
VAATDHKDVEWTHQKPRMPALLANSVVWVKMSVSREIQTACFT